MKIKLSEIKNKQNMAITKSGDPCIVELLLRRLKTQKRGKKPTLYYKGMEVIPDVNKDDIERIIYCQHCGYQEVTDGWTDGRPCPHCGILIHSVMRDLESKVHYIIYTKIMYGISLKMK